MKLNADMIVKIACR